MTGLRKGRWKPDTPQESTNFTSGHTDVSDPFFPEYAHQPPGGYFQIRQFSEGSAIAAGDADACGITVIFIT